MASRPLRYRGFGGPARSGRPEVASGGALASWPLRAGAALVDDVAVFVLADVLLAITGERSAWWPMTHLSPREVAVRGLVTLIAVLIYAPPMMWRTNGRTLGKLAMGIRVVRADDRPMSLTRAVWREVVLKYAVFYVLGLVRVIGILAFYADYLAPLHDRENRALHDRLAGTRVVKVVTDPPARAGSGDRTGSGDRYTPNVT